VTEETARPHRCAFGGRLVPRDGWIPDNPWDHHWGRDYPPIGCSALRCERCGEVVRAVGGVAVSAATPREREGGAVAEALWAWHSGPLPTGFRLRPSSGARLYACRCLLREIAAPEDIDPPFAGPGGTMPWRCQGHAALTSGDNWNGQRWDLSDPTAPLRELLSAPDEQFGAAAARGHRVARLLHIVAVAHREQVGTAAARLLRDKDPDVAAEAAHFFAYERGAPCVGSVLALAEEDGDALREAWQDPSHPRHQWAQGVVNLLRWVRGEANPAFPDERTTSALARVVAR
jgi:hypothetical protein